MITKALEERKEDMGAYTENGESELGEIRKFSHDKRLTHCGYHGKVEGDSVLEAELQFKRFKAFYGALMDTRHNKVAQEKLCSTFLDIVMNPNEK